MKRTVQRCRRLACLFAWLVFAGTVPAADAPTAPATTSVPAEDAGARDAMRNYLQIQEQLHANQLAIEENRKSLEQASTETARALATRLQALETALGTQRTRELEMMQSSHRTVLAVAGSLAVAGFVAMALVVLLQLRAFDRLSRIPALLPVPEFVPPGPRAGDARLVGYGRVEESNARLLSALEGLERRIHELENSSHAPLRPASHTASIEGADAHERRNDNGKRNQPSPEPAHTTATESSRETLADGQVLLDAGNPEAALACFEEYLRHEPRDAEALVKKGSALERLHRLDQAIECYDAAIAADASMTIAYLHKGGLFNRMEKYSEALECYEQALRSQEKRIA